MEDFRILGSIILGLIAFVSGTIVLWAFADLGKAAFLFLGVPIMVLSLVCACSLWGIVILNQKKQEPKSFSERA